MCGAGTCLHPIAGGWGHTKSRPSPKWFQVLWGSQCRGLVPQFSHLGGSVRLSPHPSCLSIRPSAPPPVTPITRPSVRPLPRVRLCPSVLWGGQLGHVRGQKQVDPSSAGETEAQEGGDLLPLLGLSFPSHGAQGLGGTTQGTSSCAATCLCHAVPLCHVLMRGAGCILMPSVCRGLVLLVPLCHTTSLCCAAPSCPRAHHILPPAMSSCAPQPPRPHARHVPHHVLVPIVPLCHAASSCHHVLVLIVFSCHAMFSCHTMSWCPSCPETHSVLMPCCILVPSCPGAHCVLMPCHVFWPHHILVPLCPDAHGVLVPMVSPCHTASSCHVASWCSSTSCARPHPGATLPPGAHRALVPSCPHDMTHPGARRTLVPVVSWFPSSP